MPYLLWLVVLFWVLFSGIVGGNHAYAQPPVLSNAESSGQQSPPLNPATTPMKPFVIGILAKNTEQEVYRQWQPLVDFLNHRLPEFRFKIEPLGFDETLPAIENAKIDFLITNPAFYSIAHRHYATYALATRLIHTLQSDVAQFGGVVISQLGVDVLEVANLHQEEIAAVAPYSLGGYLTQKKFFKEHYNISLNDRRIQFYHSHYAVLDAILAGKAKVGLIRTGVLERKGVESMVEVLTRPNASNWHLKRSTRLYPEWPFAALAHIPMTISKGLVPVLLEWESNKASQASAQFNAGESWTVAGSYHAIFELLNEFQITPYVQRPTLTWQQRLDQYQQWVLFILALLFGLLLMASLFNRPSLWRLSKTHSLQHQLSEQAARINALQLENETLTYQQQRWQLLNDTSSEGVVIFSFSGHIHYINPYALRFWGKEHATIDRLNAYSLLSDLEDRRRLHEMLDHLDESTQSPTFLEAFSAQLMSADGRVKPAALRVSAIKHDHKWLLILNFNDDTEQKNLEKAYRQSLFVAQTYIEQSHQAIFTFNPNFELLQVNDKACQLFSFGFEQTFCGHKSGQKLPLESVSDAHIQWLSLGFSRDEQAELILQLNEIKREDRLAQFNYPLAEGYRGIFQNYQLHFSFVRSSVMGEPYFMCVAQNIAEIKEQSDSQSLASVLKHNQTGGLILDRQGQVLYANQAVTEQIGVSMSAVMAAHFIVPDNLQTNATEALEILTAAGALWWVELTYTQTKWRGQKVYFALMTDVRALDAATKSEPDVILQLDANA